MKFHVGDRVIVRKNLDVGKRYSRSFFTSDMSQYRGKIVTIKEIDELCIVPGYFILGDKNNRVWSEDMFIPVELNTTDTSEKIKSLITINSIKPKLYFV